MRYFIDTEFIDNGHTIELISIGIVAEDGTVLYAETDEFDPKNANEWVRENVFPNLTARFVSTREAIKQSILEFMDPVKYGKPELWGWCAGYDFVAFCQLFGTMMDLPKGYPHYIKDFQQVLDERSITDSELPPQEEGLHNALADAHHLKRLWGYIMRNDAWQ